MDRRRQARQLGYEVRREVGKAVDWGILLFFFVFWVLVELALLGLTVGCWQR